MTRAEIRTAARVRADQDSSTFPTDTQYNVLIDSAATEVWYELIRAGWPARPSSTTLTSSSGQFLSVGVSGIAFIQGVYRVEGSQYYELPRINEGDRASLFSSGGQVSGYNVFISSTGFQLELLPIVPGTSITVFYVLEYPGFSGDSDPWYGPARSDELIVLKSAIKACRKEGNDQGARFLEGEYVYLLQCVQDMASWANMRHSALIRDVGDPLGRPKLPGDYDIY